MEKKNSVVSSSRLKCGNLEPTQQAYFDPGVMVTEVVSLFSVIIFKCWLYYKYALFTILHKVAVPIVEQLFEDFLFDLIVY